MATKKTSVFTLSERLTMTSAGVVATASIDLASYVDVADRQGLQIHSVDFIFQGTAPGDALGAALPVSNQVTVQVTDLNRGGLVFCNDRALVASAQLQSDANGGLFEESDIYPDNYGSGSNDGRYVVNDQLYITARSTGLLTNQAINVTVRVNASVVTLGAKDFMAIAIQSTAADN
jgi:hypothetical protein